MLLAYFRRDYCYFSKPDYVRIFQNIFTIALSVCVTRMETCHKKIGFMNPETFTCQCKMLILKCRNYSDCDSNRNVVVREFEPIPDWLNDDFIHNKLIS